MTTLVNNPQEAFNLLKEDPENTFRGIWTITDEGYISIVNNTDTFGTAHSRCIFPVLLNDFSIEWTVKYIPGINPNTGGAQETPVYCIEHYVSLFSRFWMADSDLSNSTKYILYCLLNNYGNAAGSIVSSPDYEDAGASWAHLSLSREEDNSFKFVRENGKYTLYKDGEQVSQLNDPEPNEGVYLSWCFGAMNNPSLIIKEYKLVSLDGIEDQPESKRYLDKIGLSYFWDKIKSLFKTHTDNGDIHITPDEKDKLNSIDLSIYAKKSEMPDISNLQEKLVAGSNITIENNVISASGGESVDLTDYAKKSEIPDVSNLAKKSEIPDVSNLAKKSEIPDVSGLQPKLTAGNNITIENNVISSSGNNVDLSDYAKKSEIPDVSNLAKKSEIPDVSGLAKKSEIPDISGLQPKLTAGNNITIIDNVISATGSGGEGGSVDLSDYYTKTEIDSKLLNIPGSTIESMTSDEINEVFAE